MQCLRIFYENLNLVRITDGAAGSLGPMPIAVDLSWGQSFVNGFPHETFSWLRREHPVWWHPPTEHTPGGVGFWVVSRYADAVAIMRDPATYSSARGGTAIDDSGGAGILLNQTDDPQHLRLRSLVNKGFTPRTIAKLEEDLRQRARQILASVPAGEIVDFVALVAQELPLQAICSILGVPQADRAHLAGIVNAAIEAETGEVLGADFVKLLGSYGGELIAEKRRNPADDILSIIVHAGGDDGTPPLTDRELKAFFNLLFPAGAETTRSALAGAVVAFSQFPDQEARLRADPSLIRSSVEEIVRWTSPSVYKRRTVTRSTELAGQPLAEGDKVTYWEMSANRDDAGVRRSVPLRHRARPQPPRRVRPRHPFLPRRQLGPDRDPGDAGGAGGPVRAAGSGRRAHLGAQQPARGHQPPAGGRPSPALNTDQLHRPTRPSDPGSIP